MDALSGREIEALMLQGASRGLAEWALAVKRDSDANIGVGDPALDPDPSVSLAKSGRIEVEHGGRSVLIVYDGEYAAWQHENQHAQHPRGGGPKYLERALLANAAKGDRFVGSEVRKRMGGR
jgi:hypothetical protein